MNWPDVSVEWRLRSFYLEVNSWPVNLPRVHWGWVDDDRAYLAFDYGNGNSDPVLSMQFDAPAWMRWIANTVDAL